MIGETASRWSLSAALDVRRGDVVAFVGGGGKSSAMFRLAAELVESGWKVLTTTTTHIGREQAELAPSHLLWRPELLEELAAALEVHGHALVTGPPAEDGTRWAGVPPEWIPLLMTRLELDAVLVEADGARCRPFKAPAAHEPSIPPATTLLVPLAGLDAVGKPVGEAAHRPERVAALAGLALSDAITPDCMAAVLAHPDGGLKGRPAGARVRVLLNKAETPERLAAARQIAASLLAAVEAVVIGAMAADRPVREVRRPVAAVVLAAGQSLRMAGGTPKLLLPWGERTVIGQVVERLTARSLQSVVVVTGGHAEQVKQVLQGGGVDSVLNPGFAAGEMLSSLQVGVRALAGRNVAACLVVLGDQPWLEPAVVEAVLAGYAAGPAGLVAPVHHGRRGHPVLIDRRHWPELLALAPGLAPRHLLQRHPADTLLVPVETDSILQDMDTWEAYQRALGRYLS